MRDELRMNQDRSQLECGVVFEQERLLAISSLLKNGTFEIETQVRGRSMGSILPDGSQVRIRLGSKGNSLPGQVVTYVTKDRLVVHRVVQEVDSHERHYVITRGDASLCCDAPVPSECVVGVVTEFCKDGSWRPIASPGNRRRSAALVASAFAQVVVALLALHPQLSCWAARRIVGFRRLAVRLTGFFTRTASEISGGSYGFWTWLGGEGIAMRAPSFGGSKSVAGDDSPDFRLERKFLLELLSRSDASGDAQLRNEASQIDWAHLFSIGSPNLHAFLGYKLAQLGLNEQCPASLREQAVNCRRSIAAQWLRFGFDLRQLTEALTRHDVDFLLVKGAVLAFNVYPHYSLRSMADIDIIVHPESLDKALELTHKAGFRCPDRFRFVQPHALTLNPKFFVSDREVSLPLQKPGTRSLIELHTELETTEPWFRVSPRAIWDSTEETVVDKLRVRTLEKHEFLLHLLLHSARTHVFEHGLRPLLDVHLLVKLHEERWDWERLAFQVIKRGCADWVYLALKLVTDAFQTPIPGRFFEIVPQPRQLARLQHLAYQQIWAERRVHYQTPAFLGSLLAQTGPIEAARVLLRRVRLNSEKLNTQTIPPLETLQRGGFILSLRRAVADARSKIPKYYRAYRNGKLSWSNLQRARRLAEGRIEILRTLVNREPHQS